MTDINPRDLIKRLADIADALDGRKPLVSAQGQAMDGFTALANFRALADEARAYLAQPEPEGPTDEELLELSGRHFTYRGDSMGDKFVPVSIGPSIELSHQMVAFARAVLARWSK
jgi:hypothetical protein